MLDIVFDARMINNSGIGTVIQNLIPFLIKDHNVEILGNPNEISEFNWSEKTKIIETSSRIYSISEQFELIKKTPSSDLFISPHFNIPITKIKSQKRFAIIHDVYHLAYINTLSFMQKYYAKIMYQRAATLSDKVITVSRFSLNELSKYLKIDQTKLSYIHNGIDHSRYNGTVNQEKQTKTKNKYNLPDKFILFVGNVKPHKNLITLVKAYNKFRLNNSEYKLVIVGKKEGMITNDHEENLFATP